MIPAVVTKSQNSDWQVNFLLDAGIGGEITNLEDIANNEKFGSADLREAAKKARGMYSGT